MILVIGLGNIGKKCEDIRHNIGFILIDLLLKKGNFANLTNSKFRGELFKMGSSLLLKPHTYMSNSGLSVKAVNDFYKRERVIVVHDDIDINLGALRFRRGGSSGGHNGLKSTGNLCGSDYEKVRTGVGKGGNVISHALGRSRAEEELILGKVLKHSKKALLELIRNDDLPATSSEHSLKA